MSLIKRMIFEPPTRRATRRGGVDLGFVVTGDEELNRKLRKLVGAEAKRIIRQAARQALKPLLQHTRSATPTDTGELEKNIKIKNLRRSRRYVGARVTSGMASKSLNTGDAYYGAFVEFGTKPRKHKRTGKSVGAIPPTHGWMRVSADQKRPHVLRLYRELIARMVLDVARNG